MPHALYRMHKRSKEPARRIRHSPGEKVLPFGLGSTSRPSARLERYIDPGARFLLGVDRYKRSSISFDSFADELSKIAYVPNTPGDQAGVLRSLLLTMLGSNRFVPEGQPSTRMVLENRLKFGDDYQEQGQYNYAQEQQERAAQQMLRDTRLQAAMSALAQGSQRAVM